MANEFVLRFIILVSALTGWFLAQLIKMILMLLKLGKIDFSLLVSTGGMPSAHSAMVSSLATAVGLKTGFSSVEFAVTAIFASIVMFDAQSVRKAAGNQAKVLNKIVNEFFKEHRFSENRLAELLGHTRLEVGMGMLLGILTAIGWHWLMIP